MRLLDPERFYGTIFRPVFSIAHTLFQVTYPVSPLLATLMRILHPERFYGTKTAGCIPTIPILERASRRATFRPLFRLRRLQPKRAGTFPRANVPTCRRSLQNPAAASATVG